MQKQEFNGKIYKLYRGERYFSRGCKRLHVVVWSHFNGPVPKGYHVHHKNEDPTDNRIENLELVLARQHLSEHSKQRHEDPKFRKKALKHMAKIRPLTKKWHASKEGRDWHKAHAAKVLGGKNRAKIKLLCTLCGKEYETDKILRSHSKFCSVNCKSKNRRLLGIDNEQRKCKICLKSFTINKYTKTITCSKPCANQASSITKRL